MADTALTVAGNTYAVTSDGDTHWLECFHRTPDAEYGSIIRPIEPGDDLAVIATDVVAHQRAHGCGPTGQTVTAGLDAMAREFHTTLRVHGGWAPVGPTTDVPKWICDLRGKFLVEELTELADAIAAGDIVGIADGIGDVIYVLNGTAFTYGIPLDAVMAEIHRSNMTKTNTPDEAKLVKGPKYEAPQIAAILAAVTPEPENVQ